MFPPACRNALKTTASRLARWTSTAPSAPSAPSSPIAGVPPDVPEPVYASSIVHGRGMLPAYRHPRTHGIPVAVLHLRAHHPALLAQFTHFAAHAAAALAVPLSAPVPLPTQRSLWTVPRGPFAHKKAQENFERRVHKRALKAWDADADVVSRWVRYLEQHALAGVGMRVVRWHRAPLGVGRTALAGAAAQMRLGQATRAERVRELGAQIVEQEMAAGRGEAVHLAVASPTRSESS